MKRLIVLVAWLAASGRARAEAPAVSLGLVRDSDGCITPRALAQQVEARIGATFVSAAQAELFVDARIVRDGRGWRATVTASGADGAQAGERTLRADGADCHALDDDLVLVVALVIDPLGKPAAAKVETRTVYVPVAPRWAFAARAGLAVLGARLPAAALALDAALAVEAPGAWPIELGVIATERARADEDGHGAALRMIAGTLATCPRVWQRGRVALHGCVGAAVGVLAVQPRDLAPAVSGDHATGELFGRARLGVQLAGRLRAVLDAGASVPLTRLTLHYDALDPVTLAVVRHAVYAEPAVAWLASLGVAVHFP